MSSISSTETAISEVGAAGGWFNTATRVLRARLPLIRTYLLQALGIFVVCLLLSLISDLRMADRSGRFILYRDAPIYLFLFSLISIGCVWMVKTYLDDGSPYRGFSKYINLFLISGLMFATIATITTVLMEEYIWHKTHTPGKVMGYWLFFGILHEIVGNAYIAKLYVADLNRTREKLFDAERSKVEMQLKLLRQQVDPHFLFNNLSVLSSLVERDPELANEFITRFTSLYRYILATQNSDVVPLAEEVAFVQNYIYLIKQRFANAYKFETALTVEEMDGLFIVPTALQGLVENAIKHNEGSRTSPLPIQISRQGDYLTVSNTHRRKPFVPTSLGNGLESLKSRYSLLTDHKLEVSASDSQFTVKVPLIKVVNA